MKKDINDCGGKCESCHEPVGNLYLFIDHYDIKIRLCKKCYMKKIEIYFPERVEDEN